MINQVFFIFEKDVIAGTQLPVEENIFFTILATAGKTGSLEEAYDLIERTSHSPLALTLDIREPLTDEKIRFITSFLFLPSYLTLEYRPLVILRSDFPELLAKEADALSTYFSQQGIREPIFHLISLSDLVEGEELAPTYLRLLQSDSGVNKNVFFYVPEEEILHTAISSLQNAENDFKLEYPQVYSLLRTNRRLEKELHYLSNKFVSTEVELNHQKQYIDILRSDHAAKELLEYYTREYEILPSWYKRFGQILKVLAGKRTFRSLFRDDVKKYID